MKEQLIGIERDGTIVAIYDDDLSSLMDGAKNTITRASHVEPNPDGDGWIADMSPIGEHVLLGPFALRQQALDAEREFLEAKLF